MIRTLLFAPGDNPYRMSKAVASEADAVVLDLEDAVAPTAKDEARKCVGAVLQKATSLNKIFVRTNPLGSKAFDLDLEALGAALVKAKGLVIPKVESEEELYELHARLQQLEAREATTDSPLQVLAILESALGILTAQAIARAPRVQRLIFGTLDLAAELGVRPTEEGIELLHARSHLVLASRAAGIYGPLDGPHKNIYDQAGLMTATCSARDLGYLGKVVIHPAQIEPVHKAFKPSDEEVENASRVLEAYKEARAKGVGAVKLDDGTFIDHPVVVAAADLLGISVEEVSR